MLPKTDTLFSKNSPSLITRASQILAIFIALGLAGMISSILVSENINNSAAKINIAGSLRMLAARIPISNKINLLRPTNNQAILNFQQRLDMIQTKSRLDTQSDKELAALFKKIRESWKKIKNHPNSQKEREYFSAELDKLVSHFQKETEEEIRLLRVIQYLGLFIMVFISYITIYRSQEHLIAPFRLLIEVATEAGRGNFKPKADENASGELGELAKSLNEMSQQLSLTYQEFEHKVAHKTTELEQSNRSLSILYRSAHSLSSREHTRDLNWLLLELEEALGPDTLSVTISEQGYSNIEAISSKQYLFPINKHGHSFGVLIWETQANLPPKPWQEELLKAMSNLIATSSDLEHKRRTESRLEIMEERAVIARELHDSLAQSLSYLKLQISLLNKQYQKGLAQEQISSTITEISKGTNQAYKQLREILTTFRLKLDNDSIENSIQEAVNEFSDKCHFNIELSYSLGMNLLNPHQEIHLLQIIREALSNIHKHAYASSAKVTVLIEDNEVQIEIIDDGCGLPETTSKEGHFGIKIMQERAKSLGGRLQISPNSPTGTLVSLRFKTLPECS
jgi:two-component system nitrate/nitrite sensor histidine kinase NarX